MAATCKLCQKPLPESAFSRRQLKKFRKSAAKRKPIQIICNSCNHVKEEDKQAALQALDCYVTFQETIEKTGIRDKIGDQWSFEIFQEDHDPPLGDLFAGLDE